MSAGTSVALARISHACRARISCIRPRSPGMRKGLKPSACTGPNRVSTWLWCGSENALWSRIWHALMPFFASQSRKTNHFQRGMGVIKDGSRRHGELVAAGVAIKLNASQSARLVRFATRAKNISGPAKRLKIGRQRSSEPNCSIRVQRFTSECAMPIPPNRRSIPAR